MTRTPRSYFPGDSVRVTLTDLTHDTDGPVTVDDTAEVTFVVTDLAGNELATGDGTASDDDWSLIVTAPETPGPYKVIASATVGGTAGTFVHRFDVKPV